MGEAGSAGSVPAPGPGRFPGRDTALGLLLGCHPLPCLAVTAFVTAYAGATYGAGPRLLLLGLAILAGQLVVGWSNDAIDAGRDRAAGRTDKPVTRGLVSADRLARAALVALVVCGALSYRLDLRFLGLHLVAVAVAVGYNAGIKSLPLSPLPYAISFGSLPVLVHLAGPGAGGPPVTHVVAAALLGVAAHFGNTVGDAEADARTGVRGLPQRFGPERSLMAMAGLVAVAALVLLLGRPDAAGRPGPWPGIAAALLSAGVAVAVAAAARRAGATGGRQAWHLTLVAVTLVLAGFLLTV